MTYQLKEKLNAKQICERRDQIEALLTQAISLLGEADSLMKTVSNYGLSFDRNTFYSPSDANQRHRSLSNLTKQVDQKSGSIFWI
ncbi:hypothetical protein [Vibrio mediterranei]|uniref:hypothetical protein n=1 Tax=Vibrio mediterranei TaxID=689 RepID=UPI004068992A